MKHPLVEIVESIEGNGTFFSFGTRPFMLPGLHVADFGEVSFPLAESEVKRLITYAQKASFGKGTATVMDTSVRSVWEIDAEKLSFHNNQWGKCIDKIIDNSKRGFGIEQGKVEASLYKLLIYEEGDFFLPHRDSEKEMGMFATLIIGLPSRHSGGKLMLRHNDQEHTCDFSLDDYMYAFPFVSFYADCEHEVKPVTSGYRVCLVYNLLLKETDKTYGAPEFTRQTEDMARTLALLKKQSPDQPLVLLLSHQYTPANFSLDSLKYHDRPRAQAFLQACSEAGYDACLGLVTYSQMGSLEGVGYDYYDYDYDSSESDGTMGEVYEDDLYIENWAKTTTPGLGHLAITEENLLSGVNCDNDEPIEKFAEGFTGNAGMTMEYYYRYGAIIFWPKDQEINLLKACATAVKLEWLDYYTDLANDPDENNYRNKSEALLNLIIHTPLNNYYLPENGDAILNALILLKNKELLKDALASLLFQMFTKTDVSGWLDLMRVYPLQEFSGFFKEIREKGEGPAIAHYLDILDRFSSSEVEHMKYDSFLKSELKDLSHAIKTAQKTKRTKNAQIRIIYLSLCLGKKSTDALWVDNTLAAMVQNASRTYINNTLCQALMQYQKAESKAPGMLALRLREFCEASLKERVANKPSPPGDWTRSIPAKDNRSEELKLLSAFMASPTAHVFEYRVNKEYRKQMERVIERFSLDLTCETIKIGSPHTLRLTKNQNSYEKSMRNWEKDVALLKMI